MHQRISDQNGKKKFSKEEKSFWIKRKKKKGFERGKKFLDKKKEKKGFEKFIRRLTPTCGSNIIVADAIKLFLYSSVRQIS